MKSAVRPIDDAELNAYVDGQLAADRVAAVDEVLQRDAELAARVAAMRRLNADLTDALDPMLAEPIPERLLAAATPPAGRAAARVAVPRWVLPPIWWCATVAPPSCRRHRRSTARSSCSRGARRAPRWPRS